MIIKSALAPDQAGAIGVLTLAFSNDPMARWSLPDPNIHAGHKKSYQF